MKWVFVALVFLLVCQTARAQDVYGPATGNGYLAICTRDDDVHRTACNFYAAGMHNMLLTLEILGQLRPPDCSPDAITLGKKRDIFIAYLKANPSLRHLGTPLLYLRAMVEAFPCPSELK
jgi:hypothetical protein